MEDVDKDLLCVPMLLESADLKGMQERQALALRIKEGSALQREIQRNRKNLDNEIDPELVQTLETYQARNSGRLGKPTNSN
jgi:hypothetical protein